MKKIFTAVCFCIAFCMAGYQPCLAAETEVMVQKALFPVEINGVDVNRPNEQYPVISYKDIIYLPLTYNMKCYTGLKTVYYDTDYVKNLRFFGVEERTNPLYVGYPVQKITTGQWKAKILDCRIAINTNADREIENNASLKYPILKYKDVLYLPLTWEVVSGQLGWKYSFSLENGLQLDTTKRIKPIINLQCFVSGPSSQIWSMSYYTSQDGWVGYPDNTMEGNYEFKAMWNGQEEITFSLEDDLKDAVYLMNYRMADSENHCISTIEPELKDGIFTIYTVRSTENGPRETYRLKIDLASQKVIEKCYVK